MQCKFGKVNSRIGFTADYHSTLDLQTTPKTVPTWTVAQKRWRDRHGECPHLKLAVHLGNVVLISHATSRNLRLGTQVHLADDTLDDLLRQVFTAVRESGTHISPTKGGCIELNGVLLELRDPRARLSRTEMKGTLFSCLGELLWYLSKANNLDFIEYYLSHYKDCSDDGKTVYGGYGTRLFNMRGNNQIANIINILRIKKYSRQAVIQLFDAQDLAEKHKDIPCTCFLQFMIRNDRLHMFATMRSNDAYRGLPHDAFAFTMLQEIIARTLSVEIGIYKHAIGSLHLYDDQLEKSQRFLDEGWQPTTIGMPAMPIGDPWPSISLLSESESAIRAYGTIDSNTLNLDPYWKDLVRVLQIFRYSKERDLDRIAIVKKQMSTDIYNSYIEKRIDQITEQYERQEPNP